ncbi:MAG: hypothetical protein K9J80_05580 [Sulfuritalea sp.]|nr:hypothetical protein [Sulfuritalea sp.]
MNFGLAGGFSWKSGRVALGWSAATLLMLYAWQQSHFQFEQYWGPESQAAIRSAMIAGVLLLFFFGIRRRCDSHLIGIVCLYSATCLLYGLLAGGFYGTWSLGYMKVAVVSVALLPIISNPLLLKRLVFVNCWLGVLLVVLNTVPLLHHLGYLDLPFETIPRVGGGFGRPDLDPLSFGVFGRTESYTQSSTGLPRLQGWSFEPLHWAYFVFMTLGLWVLSYPSGARWKQVIYLVPLPVIALHLWAIQSTTAKIIVVIFLAIFIGHELVRRFAGRLVTSWLFFSLVLGIGLIGPFMLASADNVAHMIFSESLFSEGSNWRGKVEFLDLGLDLFTVFAPRLDDSTIASHNLVLATYLQFGYLLLVPLLWLLFTLIKNVGYVPNTRHVIALILIVLNNTLVVEGNMFLAIGAMNYLILYGWVRLSNPGWSKVA